MEYSEKLRNSSEKLKTQAKNSKTQAKNSRIRQIHLVYLPKTRPKKRLSYTHCTRLMKIAGAKITFQIDYGKFMIPPNIHCFRPPWIFRSECQFFLASNQSPSGSLQKQVTLVQEPLYIMLCRPDSDMLCAHNTC